MRGGAGAAALVVVVAMSNTPAAIASAPDWSQPVDVAGSGFGSSVGIDGRGTITAAWSTQEQAFAATRQAGSESFQPPLNLGGAGAVAPQLAVPRPQRVQRW